MKKITILLTVTCLFIAFLLVNCNKKNKPFSHSPGTPNSGAAMNTFNPGPTPYYILLTDAPAAYDAVNVDIQGIELTSNGVTVGVNVTPGIYNLLDFTNGVDTLIATGSLSVQTVQQIRLILGPNNSVVVNEMAYPLVVPSGEESGLKLQVHQIFEPGVAYAVLLDFDAAKSVVATGNGKYLLKPVIKTTEMPLSGAIQGLVMPSGVITTVTAVSASDSYSTMVDPNGQFLLMSVAPANNYTVTATPVAPYTQTSIPNVTVSLGITTITGTLNI